MESTTLGHLTTKRPQNTRLRIKKCFQTAGEHMLSGGRSALTEDDILKECEVSEEDGIFLIPANASSDIVFTYCQVCYYLAFSCLPLDLGLASLWKNCLTF